MAAMTPTSTTHTKTTSRALRWWLPRWLLLVVVLVTAAWIAPVRASAPFLAKGDEENELRAALRLLESHGVPRENLCVVAGSLPAPDSDDVALLLPFCTDHKEAAPPPSPRRSWVRSRRETYLSVPHRHRSLQEKGEGCPEAAEEEEVREIDWDNEEDVWFFLTHAFCAALCVVTAALAAGLTMGLLSLDPLMLLIKMRAGQGEERAQAAALLPIVRQHHLLLVTLLLLNSMANEALPLFLEVLVSPLVAVLLSVTLVLFFGEIIPSAVFTGPNKVEIASRLVPVVQTVMFLLWPIAFPIARLLDVLLHDHDDEGGGEGDAFDRGELSALVRIQYEERMAYKQRHKREKQTLRRAITPEIGLADDYSTNAVLGAVDFASLQAIKATKASLSQRSQRESLSSSTPGVPKTIAEDDHENDDDGAMISADHHHQRQESVQSIHVDEVTMVEGALTMKTKMALDVYTPLHGVFGVPYETVLDEAAVVQIYSSGFSRIPVFEPDPSKPRSIARIKGILRTRQLVVVNTHEQRPLSSLPLARPACVSPKTNLVDLLNLFQTGKHGHLALVCARPSVARDALDRGEALSETAGLMGIITLEDVLEALLQEQIYDETDKMERRALEVARWAFRKWRAHVARSRRSQKTNDADIADERTRLLPSTPSATDPATTKRGGPFSPVRESLLGLFGKHDKQDTN